MSATFVLQITCFMCTLCAHKKGNSSALKTKIVSDPYYGDVGGSQDTYVVSSAIKEMNLTYRVPGGLTLLLSHGARVQAFLE